MGKKQHQKDKLYLTTREWQSEWGGKKERHIGEGSAFRRLPFSACALSLQPFQTPYLCLKDLCVYDIINILPFIKKHGVSPVTGQAIGKKDLVPLKFHKNAEKKFHCPITYRLFNDSTHIVAITKSGHVYSKEAIDQLNVNVSNWKDLLDDIPFSRNDIVTIQDPTDLSKFNMVHFHHLKEKLVSSQPASSSNIANLKSVNKETRDVLLALDKSYKPSDNPAIQKSEPVISPFHLSKNKSTDIVGERKQLDSINQANYSTGTVAAGFTSTVMPNVTKVTPAVLDEDTVRYSHVKQKGYVRLSTNYGPLNIELHCDLVPRTCENFVKLCLKGYYTNTIFHRSIRNFMLQGGDPTGTGKGGESVWGGAFSDEISNSLFHSGRGIISMANSGPNTNKSQFFILYKSAKHLDRKHAVFGRLVGGMETLDKIEKIECDITDKPSSQIKILSAEVFVDPYELADKKISQLRRDSADNKNTSTGIKRSATNGDSKFDVKSTKVGKYLDLSKISKTLNPSNSSSSSQKKTSKPSDVLEDFSAW